MLRLIVTLIRLVLVIGALAWSALGPFSGNPDAQLAWIPMLACEGLHWLLQLPVLRRGSPARVATTMLASGLAAGALSGVRLGGEEARGLVVGACVGGLWGALSALDRWASLSRVSAFLSYRRKDSVYAAGRLAENLARVFGRRRVFFDHESIPVASDFVERIERSLSSSHVLIALVCPHWLGDEARPDRLWQEEDFVRLELERAMARGLPVLPVFLEGAQFPPLERIPPTLRPVTQRQGLGLRSDPHFDADCQDLVEELRRCAAGRRRGGRAGGSRASGGLLRRCLPAVAVLVQALVILYGVAYARLWLGVVPLAVQPQAIDVHPRTGELLSVHHQGYGRGPVRLWGPDARTWRRVEESADAASFHPVRAEAVIGKRHVHTDSLDPASETLEPGGPYVRPAASGWSSDGAWVAVAGDGGARIWNPESGVELAPLKGDFRGLGWSPDGQRLALVELEYDGTSFDAFLHLVPRSQTAARTRHELVGFYSSRTGIRWSPCGRWLVLDSGWTSSELVEVPHAEKTSIETRDIPRACAWLPTDREALPSRLLVADRKTSLLISLDPATGASDPYPVQGLEKADYECLSFAEDGSLLAASAKGRVIVIDVKKGATRTAIDLPEARSVQVQGWQGNESLVALARFSSRPNRAFLLAVGSDAVTELSGATWEDLRRYVSLHGFW